MKARILALLKEKYPAFVSGEEISRLLHVSRTAVWKHIRSLRETGYQIDSQSKVGYRLVKAPDRLDEHELAGLLTGKVIGSRIIYREVVDSTNNLAKELAQAGAEEGTVVVAEEQTRGKGRMGRSWYSPPGRGLWFSVVLRPLISPLEASKLTLVAAVAVTKAVRELTGIPAGIKWPNDVLIDSRKLSGILTEMSAEIDKINYLVVGIGVNVNLVGDAVPPELEGVATSLSEQGGRHSARADMLAGILNSFDSLYQEFIGGNFSQILAEWKTMSVTINRWVRVSSINSVDEGIAFDLDEDGALLLMRQDGSMARIMAGEVSLR